MPSAEYLECTEHPHRGRGLVLLCRAIAAIGALATMLALVLVAASPAAAFPAYPRTCPIANPNGYSPFKSCLIDTEARRIPTGSLANTTTSLQRPEVGINVSPLVVRYGQKFTVSAVESFPACQFDFVPSPPSGCVDDGRVGLTGFYLRLLPLLPPQLDVVTPSQYPTLRQSGPCSIPTRCTYEFVAPGPADASAARLLGHWIVAGVNVYIERGVEQGINRVQYFHDPSRTDRAEVETAIRLCPPSVPCPSEVSGTVTQQGSSRTGVAGLSVRAACPSGGTTTTDANGHYRFLLNQGQCAISVTPPSGETATPRQRRVHVSPSHNIAGVDFQVGCNHATGARDAAAGPVCLDVQIKQIGQSRSGLAIYKHFDSAEDPSKAFFQRPFSHQCASGCTNLLVTVTDPQTHAPVTNATVDASVTPVRGAATGGTGFLCDQAGPKDCASHLVGSTTDDAGQVHLLYWSPGLIAAAHPTVRIVVRDGAHVGTSERTLHVQPYLIYANNNGTLSRKETLELAYWSAGKGLIGRLGSLIGGLSALEKSLSFSLSVLIGAEKAAELAVTALEAIEPVTPILGAIELAHFASELWERQGFISTFLEALGLNPIGIDDNPIERTVSAAPSAGFEAQLANYGTAAPFHIGAGGLLWDYAKRLDFLFQNHDVAFGAQFLHIKVYEVSYCQEGEICGPGYRAYVGGGIHPELYIEISAQRNRRAQSFAPHAFAIQYDPNAWTEEGVQDHLQGLSG